MEEGKILYPELSYRIMEAAFEVHNELGPGLREKPYEGALAYEFESRNIPFERQKQITVNYKGRDVGEDFLDLVVDGKIALELKAVAALLDVHKQQTLSYVKAARLKLGILINFGTPRVEYVRILN